jgi:DNA invertase Pin-like site-specific DNA recombinase
VQSFRWAQINSSPFDDLMIQETIVGDLHKKGFQIVSAVEPDLCADDPSRKLMRQIFGAIAEYDKTMLTAKLRGARERMRARGERCEGALPFGRDRAEQRVVARLRKLRASGLTFAQVADAANTENLATRFGRRWHAMSVHRVLKRGRD